MKTGPWLLLVLVLALLLTSGCAAAPITKTAFLLDTTCAITVYNAADEAAADKALEAVASDEQCWSRTVDTSQIAVLNRDGTAVLSADTAALLTQSLTLSALTDGAFDITTAALTDLWKQAEETGREPTDGAIADALSTVGSSHLHIRGNDASLDAGTTVDLGAIAKGAIADRVAASLRQAGCERALIDLGGNIVALGRKENGAPFTVGIADPTAPDTLIATVLVADGAVVTSGSYERGFLIGNTRYSHILDPKTGRPVDNDLLSVTVLCPDATRADALSTACFVMGFERAQTLIQSLDGVDAVFVCADRTVVATEGVQFAN